MINISFYINIYKIALQLIFSLSLGNILEVCDLSFASSIDTNMVQTISFFERFRFVFGAILIAFTSTLSFYLNRSLPSSQFDLMNRSFWAIKYITRLLGVILGLVFIAGVVFNYGYMSISWIYGIGTGVNIFLM